MASVNTLVSMGAGAVFTSPRTHSRGWGSVYIFWYTVAGYFSVYIPRDTVGAGAVFRSSDAQLGGGAMFTTSGAQ